MLFLRIQCIFPALLCAKKEQKPSPMRTRFRIYPHFIDPKSMSSSRIKLRRSNSSSAISGVLAAVVVAVLVLAAGSAAYFYSQGGSSSTTTTSTPSTSLTTTTSSLTSTTTHSTSTSTPSTTTSSTTSSTTTSSVSTTTSTESCCSATVVRIGYFANINHGQALVGLFNGDYQKALGPNVQIQTYLFNAGPTEMTALLAGQIDMAYVGPSPSVNAYIASNGTALRILAGATDAGALFVVTDSSGIKNATAGGVTAQLMGKTFLAPQLGNTQDIALRLYLLQNHLVPGVNVTVQDTSNSNIVTAIVGGKADGAWVPQPYGSLILSKANAHLFLDERSLWPGGNFSTTELVASESFITNHPDVVSRIVGAHVDETIWINSHTAQAEQVMNSTIRYITGSGIASSVLNSTLTTLSFTYDPLESSVQVQAQNAFTLGFLGKTAPNISGLFDLTFLNQALTERGLPTISG